MPFITVRAMDADAADTGNGRITYSLISDTPNTPLPFRVFTRRVADGFDGVITVNGYVSKSG